MRNADDRYDFKAFGRAIKKAREDRGWTREVLAEMMDLAPRYIMSIENKGQHPSFQVFYELITLFDISVDQFSSLKGTLKSPRNADSLKRCLMGLMIRILSL